MGESCKGVKWMWRVKANSKGVHTRTTATYLGKNPRSTLKIRYWGEKKMSYCESRMEEGCKGVKWMRRVKANSKGPYTPELQLLVPQTGPHSDIELQEPAWRIWKT